MCLTEIFTNTFCELDKYILQLVEAEEEEGSVEFLSRESSYHHLSASYNVDKYNLSTNTNAFCILDKYNLQYLDRRW